MKLGFKKIVNTFLCILLVFSYFSILPNHLVKAQGSHFASGSGTGINPYIIMNADQLDNVRQYTNQYGVYFRLGENIDLNGLNWIPIGEHNNEFRGVFDGNGYAIRNLTITNSDKEYVGLFGVTNHATIKNVKLENVNINNDGTIVNFTYVGSLVGNNLGTIKNSYATGNVVGKGNTGGLVGWNGNWGQIHNSYYDGTVEGTWNVGGLTGGNSGTIRNSYSSGAYVKGENNVGGLIGESASGSGSSTKSSYSFVSQIERTSGSSTDFGRINGNITGSTTLENNYAIVTMVITGNDSFTPAITMNHAGKDGDNIFLSAAQSSAHFVNNTWDFDFFWKMPETAGFPILIENTEANPFLITNEAELNNMRNNLEGHYQLANDITLTADWEPVEGDFSGAFNGNNNKIIGLTINKPNEDNIGLFKITSNAKITDLILENVNILGQDRVGALIGHQNGFSSLLIEGVSITGTVTGRNDVGGFIGLVYNDNAGYIEDVYFRGDVIGTTTEFFGSVGGITGLNNIPISRAYVLGTVEGFNRVGSIVGLNGSSISNSYALSTNMIRSGGSYTNFGRVTGQNSGSLLNNYALAEMSEPFGYAFWQKNSAGKDGQDLTAMEAINIVSALPDSFKKNDMMTNLSTIAAQISQISNLTVQATDLSADANNVLYTINFTSSMFGALEQEDLIEVQFPNEYAIQSNITANQLELIGDGNVITLSDNQIEVVGNTIKIKLPQAVSENSSFSIVLQSTAGIKNPSLVGTYNVVVKTSADMVPVESTVEIGSSNRFIRDLALELSNSVSGAQAVEYQFTFNTSPTGSLIAGTDIIEIEFPSNYVLPSNVSENIWMEIGGTVVAVSSSNVQITNNQILITVPSNVAANTSVGIILGGINNPSMGMYEFTIKTSIDNIPRSISAIISIQQGMSLIDVAPGHVVSLGGLKWLVVTPNGETENSKLLLIDPDGEVFDWSEFKTTEPYNVFDPYDNTSLAHMLNNEFYSDVLISNERDWIVEREWNTKDENGNIVYESGSVNAKIGLLTVDEFNYWRTSQIGNYFLQSGPTYWWLITPVSGSTTDVFEAYKSNSIGTWDGSDTSRVRPAIYIHKNVVVTGGLGTEDAPFELAYGEGDTSNTFTLTFNSNGGTEIQPIVANYGSTITAPAQPVKSGYVFVGWFKDSNLQQEWRFSSDTVPNSSVTLYAKWIPRTTQIVGDSQLSTESMIIYRDNETGGIRIYFPNR